MAKSKNNVQKQSAKVKWWRKQKPVQKQKKPATKKPNPVKAKAKRAKSEAVRIHNMGLSLAMTRDDTPMLQHIMKPKTPTESTFIPIKRQETLTGKDDVVVTPSHFIRQFQNIEKFDQDYKVRRRPLASGSYGTVYKCKKRSNGKVFVVKQIDKQKMAQEEKVRLQYEVDILKNLNHQNIVKLYEVYENKNWIYLVTEFCEGVELLDEITKPEAFDEARAAHVMKQILSAVQYCHKLKICHRDLKPENILINPRDLGTSSSCCSKKMSVCSAITKQMFKGFGQFFQQTISSDQQNSQHEPQQKDVIKVIDFGLSQPFMAGPMLQQCGTQYYIAPEVSKGSYDEKCDMWSIGVILYFTVSGRPPFWGDNKQEIFENLKKGSYSFDAEYWSDKSDDVKDLITRLLEKDPKKRFSASQAINHRWIQQHARARFQKELASGCIEQMKKFNKDVKLCQAALTFMVDRLSNSKTQDKLRETFQQWDENDDGFITRSEFVQGYKRVKGFQNLTEAEAKANAIFDKADMDGNGAIDFSEWCVATIDKSELLSDDNLREAFDFFDSDNSGTIDANEIGRVLGYNLHKERKLWREVVSEVDTNGDGEIDFQEFKSVMMRLIEK